MKTNVTMVSKDRDLFGVTIKQDTKTSFMSLTDLQEAYTRKRVEMGWKDRRIEEILSNKDSAERVYYILKPKYLRDTDVRCFVDLVSSKSLIKVLKDFGVYKTTGKGSKRETMCVKEIWAMVAMELHPEMYAECMFFFQEDIDESSMSYIESGDLFVQTCNLLRSLSCEHRRKEMISKINIIATGSSNPLSYTRDQARKANRIQDYLFFLIDNGFKDSVDGLIDDLDILISKDHRQNTFCYTYIAIDPLSMEVKIGKTFNIKKRESVMKTSNPRVYIAAFSRKDIEDVIHSELKDKRSCGEWFKLNKNELEDIMVRYDFEKI